MNYSKNLLSIAAAIILISSVLIPVGLVKRAEAVTINITTDTTWTTLGIGAADVVNISPGVILTINGPVGNSGTINVNSGSVLFIGAAGSLHIFDGGRLNIFQDPDDVFATEVSISGTINIESGGLLALNSHGFLVVNNGGKLDIKSGGRLFAGVASLLSVNSGGTIDSRGQLDGFFSFNSGGTININSGGILITVGGVSGIFDVNGVTININSGGILDASDSDDISIRSGGKININSGGHFTLPDVVNINSGGTININSGGHFTLPTTTTVNINSGGKLNVKSGGKFTITTLVLKTGGTLSNLGTILQPCGAGVTIQGGSTFTGNPIQDTCISFPITHMSDTTASSGSKIHKGGNTIIGERVTSTSQLKGDKIDQITIKLRKFGTPTGNAIVGIFDSSGVLKKQFATKSASSLTTTFKDYTFKLSGGQLYTIASWDRIGIKYAGGSAANSISVMRDTNAADPFDGTKTDIQQFKAGVWSGTNTNDMYMILKQTHA